MDNRPPVDPRATPRHAAHLYPSSPLGERTEGIPTGRDVDWQPLVDYRRNGVSETTIHGAVAWASGGKLIHSFGGNVLCYGRSMMKPFMLKPLAKALAENTSWEQKAISVSSHNGSTEHVSAAMSLLDASDWGLMQTPLDVPLVQFGRQVRRPRRWYHPCSGEHAALLKAFKLVGWERVGYTLPHHPFFSTYIAQLRRSLGAEWNPLRLARDGCGLPTVSNTVGELALLYADLAKNRDEDWIWEAMTRHPDLVGGFNRLDSTILKACQGKVVAKEGADGLLGLSVVHPDFPQGLGVVIKIAHGWNPQATWYVARGVLGVLGFDFRNPYALHRQKAFLVEGIVPQRYEAQLRDVKTWDDWDPNKEVYDYNWQDFAAHDDAPAHSASLPQGAAHRSHAQGENNR